MPGSPTMVWMMMRHVSTWATGLGFTTLTTKFYNCPKPSRHHRTMSTKQTIPTWVAAKKQLSMVKNTTLSTHGSMTKNNKNHLEQ